MAIKTYTQQLEELQTAIQKIELGAQSYSHEDLHVTRGDLQAMYKREERLRVLAEREAKGGGIRSYNVRPE